MKENSTTAKIKSVFKIIRRIEVAKILTIAAAYRTQKNFQNYRKK